MELKNQIQNLKKNTDTLNFLKKHLSIKKRLVFVKELKLFRNNDIFITKMKTTLRHMVLCNKPNNQWSFSYITPKQSRVFSLMS
jgi:hypothetical protein